VCFFAGAVSVNYRCLSAAFDRFDSLAGNNRAAAVGQGLSDCFNVWARLDKALTFEAVDGLDFIRKNRNHGLWIFHAVDLYFLAIANSASNFFREATAIWLRLETNDIRALVGSCIHAAAF